MQSRRVVEFLVGSAATYVVMAACSSQMSGQTQQVPMGGTGGAAGEPEASDASRALDANQSLDSPTLIDTIMNPVPEASALPTPPASVDEPCSRTLMTGGYFYRYAEHAYPGKVMTELASVVAFGHQVDRAWPALGAPDGYSFRAIPTLIGDATVAAICVATGPTDMLSVGPYDSVRFIGP
jgi:hypothetical protein